MVALLTQTHVTSRRHVCHRPCGAGTPGAIRAGAPGFPRPVRGVRAVGQAQVGAQGGDLALAALLRLLGCLQGQPLLCPPALALLPATQCPEPESRRHASNLPFRFISFFLLQSIALRLLGGGACKPPAFT